MSSSNVDIELLSIDQDSVDDPNPNVKAMALFRKGRKLSETEIEIYENLLTDTGEVNPGLAILLLGYYYHQSNGSTKRDCGESLRNRYAHLLEWFIQNHPSSFMVWTAQYGKNDDNFEKLKNAWLRQCPESQTNLAILNNAAHFCARRDEGGDELAEIFWKRAKELNSSAIWPYELIGLYRKQINYASSEKRKKALAAKVLQEFVDLQNRPNNYLEESSSFPTNYLSPTLMEEMIEQIRQLCRDFNLTFPES